MPKYTIDEYNSDPVYYCTECLSLRIRAMDGQDYCDDCGCTDIAQTDINTWMDMYAKRYGEEGLVKEYSIFKAN